METISEYISHLKGVLDRLSHDDVQKSIDLIMEVHKMDKQIFVVGNGGSASTASHIACDLGKGTISVPGGGSIPGRKRFRVMGLTDNVATMTAWANDTSYEDLFVEPLKNLVNEGDLLIGLSVSGNSENVARAMRYAKSIGCRTIAWVGKKRGKMAEIADVSVVVDSDRYGPVEDVHLILNHIIHAWIVDQCCA